MVFGMGKENHRPVLVWYFTAVAVFTVGENAIIDSLLGHLQSQYPLEFCNCRCHTGAGEDKNIICIGIYMLLDDFLCHVIGISHRFPCGG